MFEISDAIEIGERLGREESSQTAAKRSFRRQEASGEGSAPVSKFKPPKDSNELSVNRMDLASESVIADIGIRNAHALGKLFWGWYTLSASDVEEARCSVRPSPLFNNPYHADIIIPVTLDGEDKRDDIIEYSRDLAYFARFIPWGDWAGQST